MSFDTTILKELRESNQTNIEKAHALTEIIKQIMKLRKQFADVSLLPQPLQDILNPTMYFFELESITKCTSWKFGDLRTAKVPVPTPFCTLCANYKVRKATKDEKGIINNPLILNCEIEQVRKNSPTLSELFEEMRVLD